MLITLNELTNKCGHSPDGDDYDCHHPENETGGCSRLECPVARLATMADLKQLNPRLWADYGGDSVPVDDYPTGGEDWMIYVN
jgi:hypothetical protein